jgi:hypothetical protein
MAIKVPNVPKELIDHLESRKGIQFLRSYEPS